LPHPSAIVPQFASALQVLGVHWPHTFAVPLPPQVSGAVHAGPQVTSPPHPLEMVPQFWFAWQVVTVGVHRPQMLAVPPPPQVSPATVQFPQASFPPQPSGIVPHWFAPHVTGVHAMHVPAMQSWPVAQVPQV
jgi:hypothetical protein